MTQTDITPTILVTGPTRGIGRAMLERLHQHPSRPALVLLARDEGALAQAVASSRAAGLDAVGIPVDLASLRSVGNALTRLSGLVDEGVVAPVDAAILNAGAQFLDRRHTSMEGYELTFAVDVLAQHALVAGLEPLLATHGHVVLLGSSTHRGKRQSFHLVPDPVWQSPRDLARPDTFLPVGTFRAERERGGVAYATGKRALVTLSHSWARRLARSGRRLNVYDPGLVAGTDLVRGMPGYMDWVWRNVMPAMSVLPGATTPHRTARRAVALALGDAHGDVVDGYIEMGRLTQAEPVTFDEARQAVLWEWLEDALSQARADDAPRDRPAGLRSSGQTS
ncbi:SDR family NAD(P)-dependent oxidoreductase [Microbacterium sp. BK668]|uniref:SDR family NAD(P)-dependent oxidoreductase n=1 Tax=Microbacterium sp. BK668 TaxID=2512118 RepID=UPI00105D92B0|nr:SDR family NAD(P)-dependent oxidoreductase [Microbacterium sp. BK668]TDN91709.1 NAD(P)-dependent dehydrogenase (short-subunit alcohol dehydrogenase family) [Microbacterium sp. BK668]